MLVRVALLEGMRLCVDLNSLPENIWRPDASVGPDEPDDLLDAPELPDDPDPSPDDVPPPEDEELEDDDPVVVRGTA